MTLQLNSPGSLLIDATIIYAPDSRITDIRFDVRRSFLSGERVISTLVSEAGEFHGSGRTKEVALGDAVKAWERFFLNRKVHTLLDQPANDGDLPAPAPQVTETRLSA